MSKTGSLNRIVNLIDSFYFLFKRYIPLRTYRYAICGSSNMLFDILLYFITYNFIVQKQNIDLGILVLSPHIASLFFVFPITFISGFLLNRLIAFQDSEIKPKIQFIRYFLVSMGAILLSYCLMKVFVNLLQFYPTPSRIMTILVTVLYSYTLQSKYSFKFNS